jgi:hypothetical protein
MRRAATALLSFAALAAIAHADSASLIFQVSKDNGVSWAPFVNIDPGDTARVRIIAEWTLTAGAGTWNATWIDQIDVTGSRIGDAASSFGGKIHPTTQTFAILNVGSPSASIDRADDAAKQIQLGLPTGVFANDRPTAIFTFAYQISNEAIARDVIFGTSSSSISEYFVRISNTVVPIGGPYTITPAHIYSNTIPAPATLALLTAPGLDRRRRPKQAATNEPGLRQTA